MSPATDPYREWDAAYVMGSLSPSERHEYEQHLITCSPCSSDVAELAGIPGMLSSVPADQAMAMLTPQDPPEVARPGAIQTPSMPPTLLPKFLDAARRTRTRTGTRVAAWVAAGVSIAAALLVIAVAAGLIGSTTDDGELTMTQTQPGPITAQASFDEQPWGTAIELECSYAMFFGGRLLVEPWDYALVVIDTSGGESQQATWEAVPGSTVHPTATTALHIDEIDRIQIRVVETGRVLLEVSPGR